MREEALSEVGEEALPLVGDEALPLRTMGEEDFRPERAMGEGEDRGESGRWGAV